MNASEIAKTEKIIFELDTARIQAMNLKAKLTSIRMLAHDYQLWRSHGIGNAADSAENLEREIAGVIRGIKQDAKNT